MHFLKWLSSRFQKGNRSAARSLRLAHSLVLERYFDEARIILVNALDSKKEITNPTLLKELLRHLYSTWHWQERNTEAITFFDSYIAQAPDDAFAYTCRASAFWQSGALDEAVRDFSTALKLNPEDAIALSGRGQVLLELNKYDPALHDLDSALELLRRARQVQRRAAAYTRNGRAAALLGLGRIEEGLKEFEASLAICPNNAWVYFNRARFYDSRMEREKAICDYHASLARLDPPLSSIKREEAQRRLQELDRTQ